jgi:hypothetical protein
LFVFFVLFDFFFFPILKIYSKLEIIFLLFMGKEAKLYKQITYFGLKSATST